MKIGEVVSASVLKGIEAKLMVENPEELRIGYPVIVEGEKYDFYCVVRDVYSPNIELVDRIAGTKLENLIPPTEHEGMDLRSRVSLKPIQLVAGDGKLHEPQTIPPYLAGVRKAKKEDVAKIYQPNANSRRVGTLHGVKEFPVELDFAKLTAKPFALFGRTGVGKSILCKIICNAILQKNIGSVLVFDMHQEYSLYSKTDRTPGLKYFFPERVETFTLDFSNKEAKPFLIDSRKIRPEDLIVAFQDLSPSMVDALYAVSKKRDKNLITAIKEATPEDYEMVHPSALQALQRRIARIERLDFVREGKDVLGVVKSLLKAKKSIVLDFGSYGTEPMAYLFLANILARRLYSLYTRNQLPRLILFLEEAHKFLAPGIINNTVFGRLARETRKFNLILAIIDQRPNRIDEEVRSQLANRLILSLKEPSDISSALAGIGDRSVWEGIVYNLPSRTSLIIGDACRVPTVVDVLHYSTNLKFGKLTKPELDELGEHAEKVWG